MEASYYPKKPIDILFNQIEDGQCFAVSAKAPFSKQHLLDMGELLIVKNGAYSDSYTKWRAKRSNPRTWANFKIHFCKVQTVKFSVNRAKVALLQRPLHRKEQSFAALNFQSTLFSKSKIPNMFNSYTHSYSEYRRYKVSFWLY